MAEDDRIARAIVTAIAHENSPKGYEAEKLLVELLDERYDELKIADGEDDLWYSASQLEDKD